MKILLLAPLLPALALAQQRAFTPIDMSTLGVGNFNITGIGPVTENLFPYGNPSQQGGVPFILTKDANDTWAAFQASGGSGSGDVVQVFNINVPNIYGMYTLAGLWWGRPGAYVTYTFNFSDGTSYSKLLTNGVDLRDFNKNNGGNFANTINGTTTQVFYDDPNTDLRLDRQWVDLGAAGFGGKTLTSFVITDTGSGANTPDWSRMFLLALTAQTGLSGEVAIGAIPEPSTYGLFLGGLALAAAALRRRQKGSGRNCAP